MDLKLDVVQEGGVVGGHCLHNDDKAVCVISNRGRSRGGRSSWICCREELDEVQVQELCEPRREGGSKGLAAWMDCKEGFDSGTSCCCCVLVVNGDPAKGGEEPEANGEVSIKDTELACQLWQGPPVLLALHVWQLKEANIAACSNHRDAHKAVGQPGRQVSHGLMICVVVVRKKVSVCLRVCECVSMCECMTVCVCVCVTLLFLLFCSLFLLFFCG